MSDPQKLTPLADLVSRFSLALAAKLGASEQKYGFNDAWLAKGWETTLRKDLQVHVDKGDPIDVAAYCAFAWHHGWAVNSGTFRIDALWLVQRAQWSMRTFGPEQRVEGVCKHLEKELAEARANPEDATEWADIILLAFDGAFRAGHSPEAILTAIRDKQRINTERKWADWRTAKSDAPIEHLP